MTDTPMFLKLRIAGHLDPGWSEWFAGMEMHHLPDGSTALTGQVEDQAALYGLLYRARDLGLTMLAVTVSPHPAELGSGEGTDNEPDEAAAN